MNINSVCLLGGTGFVGRHLAYRLANMGKRIRIITRYAEPHRQMAVHPNIELVEADTHAPVDLQKQFRDQDAVINLVGILNEKQHDGSGFRYAHTELSKKVVNACLRQNVKRLLHMSALNASVERVHSHYLRSKGEAENQALTFSGAKLAVTVFRPSVIFGPDDSFFNRFAQLLKLAPVMPLACPETRFAPVYVGDVVEVFANSLEDEGSFSSSINLCGPKVYTLKQLVQYTAHTLGKRRLIIGLPDKLSHLQATVMEYLPGKPFSLDNYYSLRLDSVCDSSKPCPTSLESVVPGYLGSQLPEGDYQRYRQGARRSDTP